MITHAPPDYDCPFCRLARGDDTERSTQDDVVQRDEFTTAFIAAKWWPGNEGHILVVPNEHYENIYTIPQHVLMRVYARVQRIAEAIRGSYGCEGTSTRQHNEPGGSQDVWHFHVHVFPRYDGDRLYERHAEARWTTPEERAPHAARLDAYFNRRR